MGRRRFPPPQRWVVRPRFYKAPNAPDLTVPPRIRLAQSPQFRRIKKSRIRRGRYIEPTWPQAAQAPISSIPAMLRPIRRTWPSRNLPVRVRPSSYLQDVPIGQIQPVKSAARRRVRQRRAATGQFFIFSPDLTTAQPIAGPNRLIRPKLRRRGQFFGPPAPPDLTVPVPIATGYDHDRLVRPPRVRSAGFLQVPQVSAPVVLSSLPAILRPVRRIWPTRARAGNFLADVVPAQLIPAEITTRNRIWPARTRPGRFVAPPAPPDLTAPTPANRRALRRIHPSLARGCFYGPPAPPDLTAPVPIARRIARRVQVPKARAGQFFKVGLGAVAQQTAQALPPSIVRMFRPVHPSRSRGHYFAPPAPPDLTTPIPLVKRIARRIWPSRARGRFLSVPVVPAAPSALPPLSFKALRRPLPASRRARYGTIPTSAAVPAPCTSRHARALPAPRRGHQISPPAPPDLTAPLPRITRRPRFDTPCRRGHFGPVFPPIPNPPWCPSAGQSGKRRHRPRWVRRGQNFSPHLIGLGVGGVGNLSVTGDPLGAAVIGDPLTASVAGDRLAAMASGDPGTMIVTGDPAPPTVS